MDCRQGKQGDCDRYHGPGFKVNNKSDSKVNQKYAAEILALKSKLEVAKSTALPIETSSFFQ